MGVDNVRLFLPNDLFQNMERTVHCAQAAQVQRRFIMADARVQNLRNIDTAVGHHGHIMPHGLELF